MPITANAIAFDHGRFEMAGAPAIRKNAATMLNAVASKPGPRPPMPAEIRTGGTK